MSHRFSVSAPGLLESRPKVSEATRRNFIKGCGALIGSASIASLLVKEAYATNYNWYHVPGKAKDIGAGGGQVWVIGNDPTPNGDYVFLLTGDPHNSNANPWTKMGGGGTQIAVDDKGRPWVVNAQGDIFSAETDEHDHRMTCVGVTGCRPVGANIPGVERDMLCGCQ
jgi:Tectonin domain